MAVYQCFFFSRGRVSYWENIECDGRMPLTVALRDRLKNGKWKHAEEWSDGKLVCDVRRSRPGNEDASNLASNHSVWRSDGQAGPERQPVRDEVPVAAEPGFYEPGRSPSLVLANWFWLRHIAHAVLWWRS
jgi:hypothetical protein